MKNGVALALLLGCTLTTEVYALSNEECKTFLTAEDVAQAFGQPKKPLSTSPSFRGCTYPMGAENILVTVEPIKSEKDWNYAKTNTYVGILGAKAVQGIGADAVASYPHLWFLSSDKHATVTLTSQEDGEIRAKLAHAIDRNISKMKSIKIETQPISENYAAVMKSAQMRAPQGHLGAAQPLSGFLPDILICPSTQAVEVNRMTYGAGKTIQAMLILMGVQHTDVATFYKTTLMKKGWTIQSNEFHEAVGSMKDQATAAGYKGTGEITFVKGSYTVLVGITPAGTGVSLNITQTKN